MRRTTQVTCSCGTAFGVHPKNVRLEIFQYCTHRCYLDAIGFSSWLEQSQSLLDTVDELLQPGSKA